MIDPKTMLDEEVTVTTREFKVIDSLRAMLADPAYGSLPVMFTDLSAKTAFAAVLTAGLGVVKVSDAGDKH